MKGSSDFVFVESLLGSLDRGEEDYGCGMGAFPPSSVGRRRGEAKAEAKEASLLLPNMHVEEKWERKEKKKKKAAARRFPLSLPPLHAIQGKGIPHCWRKLIIPNFIACYDVIVVLFFSPALANPVPPKKREVVGVGEEEEEREE